MHGPEVADQLRTYSRRTARAYLHWIGRLILFHDRRHPRQLAQGAANRFQTHLAVKEHAAACTQKHALTAILFLYEHARERPLDRIEGVVRTRRPQRLPVVLTVEEVSLVIVPLSGEKWLIAMLWYGGGLRLLEAFRLRANDLDFQRGEITVREGKGEKGRVTTMPRPVLLPLKEHLRRVEAIQQQDLVAGYGRVELPHALASTYPNASREWGWQFVFAQQNRWVNPRSSEQGRHHVHESLVQKAIKQAVPKAGMTKRVTTHTLRRSFAMHMLDDGYDIRTVQELLGDKDVGHDPELHARLQPRGAWRAAAGRRPGPLPHERWAGAAYRAARGLTMEQPTATIRLIRIGQPCDRPQMSKPLVMGRSIL